MNNAKWVLLFVAIQIASLALAIIGLPICAVLSLSTRIPREMISPVTGKTIYVWPRWAWLWSNDEDGVWPVWYERLHPTWGLRRIAFTWTALRNSVGNLRFVPGVSGKGRPLWEFKVLGRTYLAGWHSNGWPTLTRYTA